LDRLKILSALLLALLIAASMGRPAAAEFRTNGRMSLDFSLDRNPVTKGWTRMIQSSLDLNAEFFPGNWDNAKVVVQTGGSTHNSSNSDELSIVPSD